MWIRSFLITLSIFTVIDLIWLGIIAQGLYQHFLSHLMRETPFWPAAFLFYFCYIIGLMYFVINPAIEAKSSKQALIRGSFFGFITYMTYEFTNWAVIAAWPLGIVFIDIMWGVILCSLVSFFSSYVYLRFFS